MCQACETLYVFATEERKNMEKFEIGDRVVFTAKDVNWFPWNKRKADKTPGKIVGFSGPSGETAEIVFEDTLGVENSGTGWSGLDQIEHLFEVDQVVTGPPMYPIAGTEKSVTGTVLNPDTTSSDGTRILMVTTTDMMRYILRDGAEPVRSSSELNQEEEIEMTQERPFVGKAPEPARDPEYVLPFKIEQGDTITDANGRNFAETSFCSSFVKDKKAAEIVRDALNAYFADSDPVEQTPEPFVPRVLFAKNENTGKIDNPGVDRVNFAYEVAPGRFWWAESREKAMLETDKHTVGRGWAASKYDNLYDVTDPNGPKVVTE